MFVAGGLKGYMMLFHSMSGQGAHLAFEAAAYLMASRVYWAAVRAQAQPDAFADRLLILGCVIFLAAAGSKALHVLEHLGFLLRQGAIEPWLAGKSVLGGLIGGTLGAELGKKLVGWRLSTGDAWVPALTTGLLIGRMGCQLSGVWDQTYGNATLLPWAWDYGDGIARHPTALYEILLVAGLYLLTRQRWHHAPGARFAGFLLGYCVIRFAVDFLKPPFGPMADGTLPATLYWSCSAIQWAAVLGGIGYACLLRYRLVQAKPLFQKG